jgi:hypothetical protein
MLEEYDEINKAGKEEKMPVGWGELANPNTLRRLATGSIIRGLINDRLDGR